MPQSIISASRRRRANPSLFLESSFRDRGRLCRFFLQFLFRVSKLLMACFYWNTFADRSINRSFFCLQEALQTLQMGPEHKMSIISASRRPRAILSPFLEFSFRSRFKWWTCGVYYQVRISMVIVHTPGILIMIATNSPPPIKSRLPVKASNNFSLFPGTWRHPRQSVTTLEARSTTSKQGPRRCKQGPRRCKGSTTMEARSTTNARSTTM